MSDADIAAIKAPDPTVWMRAPIGGTVVDNKAQRGAAVNPGDVLFTVGTLERGLDHRRHLRGRLVARAASGSNFEAVTTAYPDEVFHGVIARISPNIDPEHAHAQIRCQVHNPGGG